jgi:hypothetical protein
VQLVDLVCMLVPDQRVLVAECLFLQASVDRFLRGDGVASLDVDALRHGCALDPVASVLLEASAPAGQEGVSSFVTRSSGRSVFGMIPSLLPEQLLRFIKDQLTCVAKARVGSGAATQRPLFSSLRDCLPMSLSAGVFLICLHVLLTRTASKIAAAFVGIRRSVHLTAFLTAYGCCCGRFCQGLLAAPG